MRERTESGSSSQFIYLTKLVWYDIMEWLSVKRSEGKRVTRKWLRTGSQIVYLTNAKRYDIINELSQTRKRINEKELKDFRGSETARWYLEN